MRKPLIGIGGDVAMSASEGREKNFVYETYVDAVRRAGGIPLIIPPQSENVAEAIEQLDGILLAGGDDCDPTVYGEERHPTTDPMDRRRQENDLAIAKAAREKKIPTLGICLGSQVMAVAAGGKLVQDIPSEVGGAVDHVSSPLDRKRHKVVVDEGTSLARIVGAGELEVNSSHHQSVKDPGNGLRETAHAPDGVVEGVEDPAHPLYVGVQWHPEDMKGEVSSDKLFHAFIEAASRYRSR